MGLIYYVGKIGDETRATFVHTQNIAMILKKIGHEVIFFDYGRQKGTKELNGFKYHYATVPFRGIPGIRGIAQDREVLFGNSLFSVVKSEISKNKPDAVILFGHYAQEKLTRLCTEESIPVFIDRCDWFELDHYKDRFSRTKAFPRSEILKGTLDLEANGAIAISQYLYNYYNNHGVNTIMLPPVFPMNEKTVVTKASDNVLKLVYAGMMGASKDNIWPVIVAVDQINKEKIRIQFDVIGPNEKIIAVENDNAGLQLNGIIVHGVLAHNETLEIIKNADFSVLIRKKKKYAIAGFSTKFAESMTYGVPVLANKVGGADTCICDMENGVLLETDDSVEIKKKLEELLRLSHSDIISLKNNAAHFASSYFNLNTYVEPMKQFLERGNLK